MKLPFDSEQLQAIQTDVNTVVTAGAGSGKTSVLVERFCWLVERGTAVDQILALTFTRLAAAEMYERIYERLRRSEQPRIREQIRQFDQAQISTLDSFCSLIVRNASQRFGLPPDFVYNEEKINRMTQEFTLDFLLSRAENPALRSLIHSHGFEAVWQDLFCDLALKQLTLQEINFTGLFEQQMHHCRKELTVSVQNWTRNTHDMLNLAPRVATIQSNQNRVDRIGDLKALLAEEAYSTIAGNLNDFRLKRVADRGKEDLAAMNTLAEQLNQDAARLQCLSATLAQRELLKTAYELLQSYQSGFNALKRQSRLLTFQDICQLAVQALLGEPPLRNYYKNRFRYILIDEFQDNNQLQKDLVFLLAEKKELCGEEIPAAKDLEADKLFFVGDEKQSIYRFRGADVSVFTSLRRELVARGGQSLPLHSNYRSQAGLIHFFNSFFQTVMSDASRPYEAQFENLTPGQVENTVKPQIFLFHKPYSEEKQEYTNQESEAYHLACFLKKVIGGRRLKIIEGDQVRPAEYSHVTLLMRSTGNQIHYERMFRHFDIPFTTQNARGLFVEAPTHDMYALLQLAVYPEDRAAYAAVLRSPFVHAGDDAVIQLLLQDAPPFEGFRELPITAEDRTKLEAARELYRTIRDQIDRVPIAQLIHTLWYHQGYRYTLLQKPRFHSYLEYYDYLIALAERVDREDETMAHFLAFLRRNLGVHKKLDDLDLLRTETRGVQIMSIHKSKGLQFPVVILADTGNRGRNRNKTPYSVSDRYGISLALGNQNFFDRFGQTEEEKKDLAELKRLLYVALTRAKNHLILSGCLYSRDSERALITWIFRGLGASIESPPISRDEDLYTLTVQTIETLHFEELSPQKTPTVNPDSVVVVYEQARTIQRRALRNDYAVTELAKLLFADPAPTRELPALDIDYFLTERRLESAFGTLVHRLLSDRLRGVPSALDPEPWLVDLPDDICSSLLTRAADLCDDFFSSDLGLRVKQAISVETEFPFVYHWIPGPLFVNGQIDLLLETQQAILVIDFKTDRIYRRSAHQFQLGLYSLAAEQLIEGKTVEPFLFFLRSAEAIALPNGWREHVQEDLSQIGIR